MCSSQRTRLGDVAAFENRQPVTEAKFINKSSLFILLLGFIRRLELKPISEQKAENIFRRPAILSNRLLWAGLLFIMSFFFSD